MSFYVQIYFLYVVAQTECWVHKIGDTLKVNYMRQPNIYFEIGGLYYGKLR